MHSKKVGRGQKPSCFKVIITSHWLQHLLSFVFFASPFFSLSGLPSEHTRLSMMLRYTVVLLFRKMDGRLQPFHDSYLLRQEEMHAPLLTFQFFIPISSYPGPPMGTTGGSPYF